MPKVLFVDQHIEEDEAIGLFYKDELKDFGIDCIYTGNYDTAFIFLSRERYDAILFDPISRIIGVGLNYTDGMIFIKRLKETHGDIPIVILTTASDIEEELEKNKIKVSGIVRKSIDTFELIKTLNDVLNLSIEIDKITSRFLEYDVRIFICYAKEDIVVAHAIYEILKQNGYRPWIDKEDLVPGQEWELEIEKAIAECNFFLACMSKNSVSKEGYVQKELKKGLDILDRQPEGSIFLIPVRLDDCKVPSRFAKLHWCNFAEKNAIRQLLDAVKVGCEQRGLITK